MNSEDTVGNRTALTVAAVWLAAAILVGASGVLQGLRPPLPQVVLFGLTALLLAAGALVPAVRRWAMAADLRIVPAFQVTRFVGIWFLVLYGRGELPYAFAVPGGIGDIAAASFALGLLALGSPANPTRRRLWLVWNSLGLIDILYVVAAAANLAMREPGSMAPLLRLPLSLLPTFVVPIIIASHVLVFVRLLRAEAPRSLAALRLS